MPRGFDKKKVHNLQHKEYNKVINAKKTVVMFLLIVAFCIIMAAVDGILMAGYVVKSIVKLVLFLMLPAVYSFCDKDVSVRDMFVPDKKGIVPALLLGVSVYALILGGYFLLKDVFDFSSITGALTKNTGVTRDNFVFVSLYISFVNSLLEEFFFRGFAFLNLRRIAGRKVAYIFSATVFAVYHIAMMVGWFGIGLFLLVMAGLFAGGLIFNYLNEKSSTIYPSWFVHMFANFAINTVGFMLFGII